MNAPAFPSRSRGFSMVEILVSLAIGLATVVIMLQMLKNSDVAKRTASGGNDAQMSGALALFTLERDIRASGYGINDRHLLGCTLVYKATIDGMTINLPLAPVTINPPITMIPRGDDNTDTLLVVYSTPQGSVEGDALIANSSSGSYQVTSPLGFKINDQVIAQSAAEPASPCTTALSLDKVVNINSSTLTVVPGVGGLPSGSILYNMGATLVVHAYAIRNGALTMCDYTLYDCSKGGYSSPPNPDVWVPVSGNIVSLRAQYGHDQATFSPYQKVVSIYDQVTPGSADDKTGYSVQCGWARTLSLRLAVVARSNAYDKQAPTTKSPTWTGSTVNLTNAPTNPFAVTLDLSAGDSWQNFRYKSMETTVPLRNAIWQGGDTC